MCGRFTQTKTIEEVIEEFKASPDKSNWKENAKPRYNVTPSQEILAVRDIKDEGRRLSYLEWGLIPPWSKDGKSFINARAETLLDKPTFRDPFKKRCCLIPATGFYEWGGREREKQPYYFQLKGGELFAFAGIWNVWQWEKGPKTTCAIITTRPNEIVSPYHDRMPAILRKNDYEKWLNGTLDEASELLDPYPASDMKSYAVSKDVNSPGVDESNLIHPLERVGQ